MAGELEFRYSEIFGNTFQGEGHYTGVPTVWYRAWGCNFNCSGFGQDNPEDPSTYDLPFQDIDVSKYKTMEELPVFSKGCDSSYSWSQKFLHLARRGTAKQITEEIRKFLVGGTFQHPESKQWAHLAFTGGEPMISQRAVLSIILAMDTQAKESKNNALFPRNITIETNGTQPLFSAKTKDIDPDDPKYAKIESPIPDDSKIAFQIIKERGYDLHGKDFEIFWSVSPKLYLSGEKWEQAIKPHVLHSYKHISDNGQLKFVVNGTDKSWDEVKRATDAYRGAGIDWPVWIMPVGADIDGQNKVAAAVSEGAIQRGYNVSARVHTYVFGNVIGK